METAEKELTLEEAFLRLEEVTRRWRMKISLWRSPLPYTRREWSF